MPCSGGVSACAPSLWGGLHQSGAGRVSTASSPPSCSGSCPHGQGSTEHQGWLYPSHGWDLQGPHHTLRHEGPWFWVLCH